MSIISDVELDLIEEQAADYGLELYPIEGVALDAIIKRLRNAETTRDRYGALVDAAAKREELHDKIKFFLMMGALVLFGLFALAGCGHGCSQTEFLTNSLCR